MADYARMFVIAGTIGVLAAGGLAGFAFLPAASAQEAIDTLNRPAKDFFPPSFDPEKLKKFDVAIADSVSTDVDHTDIVGKIAFGKKSVVTILSTPTGTYSSDALLSPNIRYPGIDVTRKDTPGDWAFTTEQSPYGTRSWSSFTAGSFTYLTYNFAPARDHA
jgi:hypothetical protein